jgi:hypothetical protein
VTFLDGLAAFVAALAAGAFAWTRKGGPVAPPGPTSWARFVLWLAIASPLFVLLVPPSFRPRVFVRGPGGSFEAIRAWAFAAAAAAAVASFPRGPRRAWSAALLVLVASAAGVTACVFYIRWS